MMGHWEKEWKQMGVRWECYADMLAVIRKEVAAEMSSQIDPCCHLRSLCGQQRQISRDRK
jgi:hypothetical protein